VPPQIREEEANGEEPDDRRREEAENEQARGEGGLRVAKEIEESLGSRAQDDRKGERNENRAERSRDSPRSRPVAIVKPDRENPAISPAAACASPIHTESAAVTRSRSRTFVARRSPTASATKK
jgi:hypothetical protein